MADWEKAREEQIAYIREREQKHMAWRIGREADVSKEINKVLRNTERIAKETLDRWIIRFAQDENITPVMVAKLVQSQDMEELADLHDYYVNRRWRHADKITPFTKKANEEMKKYIFTMRVSRQEYLLRNLQMAILDGAIQQENILQSYLYRMTIAEVMRQSGILGFNVQTTERLKRNAELIATADYHAQTFSQRIWQYQDLLQARLDDGIQKSILLGQHPNQWAEDLNELMTKEFKGNEYAMSRLAVTETGRVQIAVQADCYKLAGIDQYMVIAEPTACPICMPYNEVPQKLIGMRPGINAPMFHPNCRCSTTAYVAR
jgi:SPP1 gp7 family putative phage head morphogenesis protein